MDDSAREAAPCGTEELDAEDNEDRDEDADAAKDGRTSKTTELLEQFCSRAEKISKGGSYRWTCLVCSTDSRPSILSGSSSKVLTHFLTSGAGDVRICNGIFNDKASQGRLKEARQVCGSQLQE